MSDRWLILGSGPSAPDWYDKVRPLVDKVATCNAGIELCPQPDVYALCEAATFPMYAEQYRKARETGTRVITIDCVGPANKRDMDEVLPVLGPDIFDMETWEKGVYRNGVTTGSILVQYAVNNGATEVHLVGFEGYHAKTGPGQFVKTNNYQGPLFYRMAAVCPEVQFTFYGRPLYDVSPAAIVKDS